MSNITAFPQALSPRCTITHLRGLYSHLTADFYRAFEDKDREAREPIKSRLHACPAFFQPIVATCPDYSVLGLWQSLASAMRRGLSLYGLASHYDQALKMAANAELDVLIAKVPRCAKRNLQCCGRQPKKPKMTLRSEISMETVLLSADGAMKLSPVDNLSHRPIRPINLLQQ